MIYGTPLYDLVHERGTKPRRHIITPDDLAPYIRILHRAIQNRRRHCSVHTLDFLTLISVDLQRLYALRRT